MNAGFQVPGCPLIVYTDLDGTLLDHDTYRFDAALPALRRLQALSIPIVPVTSKTLAELDPLLNQLQIAGPCIAENGALIATPLDYFSHPTDAEEIRGRFQVRYLARRYDAIKTLLASLRAGFGFVFTGFADMDDAEVARLTGLDVAAAALARQRLASEPLLWRDSAAALAEFNRQLQAHGCTLVAGGRFHHVLGDSDKAGAIARLNRDFVAAGFSRFTTVALGDSPNDASMLQASDIAVVVSAKDGPRLSLAAHANAFTTRARGPQGWNEFFHQHLDDLLLRLNAKRTHHG